MIGVEMIHLRGHVGAFGRRGRSAIVCMLLASLPRRSSSSSHAATAASTAGKSRDSSPMPYELIAKRRLSPDSHLLRYSLPIGRRTLGDHPTLPTCIKVVYNPKNNNDAEEKTTPGGEMTTTVVRRAPRHHHRRLEKSYSPISHPATEGYFDLIVKSYPPSSRTRGGGGGGVGRYLCDMSIGEYMYGSVKPYRVVHGDASVLGRWTNVGLVAGGTGIAPLLQIARIILDSSRDDDADTMTTIVRLLYFNRREEDILARDEIEDMVRMHPKRFIVSYSLTDEKCVPVGWTGYVGRGDVSMISSSLPPPTTGGGDGDDGKTMIFVCGTDGFVSAWGGPVVRAPPTTPPDDRTDGEEEGDSGNNKEKERRGGKIQGPLLGLLREAGYAEEEVYKY